MGLERAAEADLVVPARIALRFDSFEREVGARSEIVWGEHCSECAVPICYSTCNFYSPRTDLTCRRFVAGIETIRDLRNLRRVRFRKWGKLEGSGPSHIRNLNSTKRSAAADSLVSWWLEKAPLPFRMKRHLAWRWNRLVEQNATRSRGPEPDAFAITAWSANGETHPFTVTFLEKSGSGIFQEKFTVGPEYCQMMIPLEQITENLDLARPYLVQIEPASEAGLCDVVFGICDFISTTHTPLVSSPTKTLAAGSTRAKVVVWDLDNTVWDGTLAEDGLEGIVLKTEAAKTIVELDRRGILNSVASKNDPIAATEALKKFGLLDYFVYPQMGWGPKSEAVERISQLLDLGLDTFVFIDDQPFERGEVQETHCQVTVLAETSVSELLSLELCDVPTTAESGKRRAMYQAEARRSETFRITGTNYLDFLSSSQIVLETAPLDLTNCERIYELSQRTNQLNFFGTKYRREDVQEIVLSEARLNTFVLKCHDKFGEYGVIGFAVVDMAEGLVVDFFMSCRVQRKCVENAFFAMLTAKLRNSGLDQMSVRFRRTERNGAAVEMLKELGFSYEQTDKATGIWSRSLKTEVRDSAIVCLVDHTSEHRSEDQRGALAKIEKSA